MMDDNNGNLRRRSERLLFLSSKNQLEHRANGDLVFISSGQQQHVTVIQPCFVRVERLEENPRLMNKFLYRKVYSIGRSRGKKQQTRTANQPHFKHTLDENGDSVVDSSKAKKKGRRGRKKRRQRKENLSPPPRTPYNDMAMASMVRPFWFINRGQRLELLTKTREPCSGCGDGETTTYLSSPSETIKVQVHGPSVMVEFLRPHPLFDNEGHHDDSQQQQPNNNNDISAATRHDPHPANFHSVQSWRRMIIGTCPDLFDPDYQDNFNQVLEDILDMESDYGVDVDSNLTGRRPSSVEDIIIDLQSSCPELNNVDSEDESPVANDVCPVGDYIDIDYDLLHNAEESFPDIELKDGGFLDESDFSEAQYEAMKEWWGLN